MNKKIFGVECLGCGTQRALLLVCKGDFTAAYYQFPAIFTTLLLVCVLGLHFIDKARNYNKCIIWLAIGNAIIMIISYICKINSLLN